MNSKYTAQRRNAGAPGNPGESCIGRFSQSFTRTEEFREVMRAVLPEILAGWAGTSRIKKACAGVVGRVLAKGFAPQSGSDGNPVVEICADPDFARGAVAEMPELLNAVIAGLGAFTKSLSGMPADESGRLLQDVIESTDLGGIGEIITNLVKSANRHRGEAGFITEALRPKVRSLVAAIDFGEIKEAVDGSSDSIITAAAMINEELWEYPAKMVCALSLIPALANIGVRFAGTAVAPINKMAPDLLTDVAISLVRDIEGKNIGALINELCEIVRKIHTGSALIGDRGSHAVPSAVSRLAADTLEEVDIPLLIKSRGMLREMKDLVTASVIDVLEKNPGIASDFFQSHFRKLASWVRSWSLKAATFERALCGEDIAREFARGMSEIDAQEVASVLSGICGLFNQVRDLSPGTVRNFLSQFFGALDEQMLAETVRWLVGDVVESMKPIAPEILPPIIGGIAELIAPDGVMSDEMKEACDKLGKVFNNREGRS